MQLSNDAAASAELDNSNHQPAVSDTADVNTDDVNGTSVVECDSFCDFVRFEGTVTEQCMSSGSATVKQSTGDDAGTASLLRACIEQYKLLFEALVAARVLHDNQSLTASFIDQFVTTSCDKSKSDNRNVGPLHVRCVDRVELSGVTKTVMEALSLSCQLLVDFSALPIYSESAMLSPAANGSGKRL